MRLTTGFALFAGALALAGCDGVETDSSTAMEPEALVAAPTSHEQLRPDLTVVEDDRSQWRRDPDSGRWYWGMARGFDVKNIGAGSAGKFHVSVLQGPDSYVVDVPGLAPGASLYFQITKPSDLGPACGVNAVILVNSYDRILETNDNNDATTIAGICLL